MHDVSESLTIVYNGEIYNYLALRQDLVADGYRFATQTDTEVILNLWHRDGRGALGRLEGMFAFAIFDRRSKVLTLARDQFGVKPLYYSASAGKGMAFASEIKALLQIKGSPKDLDPLAVLNHVTYLWSPGSRTMLAGIRKLEPGTWLESADGRVVGTGSFRRALASRSHVDNAPAQLAACLERAVTAQLVSDVPVGAFLSGGVDSTAIVALARKQIGPFDCFSIAGDAASSREEGFSDDLAFAEFAAKTLDVRLHVARATTELSESVDFMIYHMDEPQADLAPLHVHSISSVAGLMGVKVLLSGAGGDDLFGGYRRHMAMRINRYWSWTPRRARQQLRMMADRLPVDHPVTRRARKALQHADLDGHAKVVAYLWWIDQQHAMTLLNTDLAAEVDLDALDEPFLHEVRRVPEHNSDLARLLSLDERFFLTDHNFNYTDKMSMAAGVEVRVPFMDSSVVELAHRLSDRQLVRGTTTKHTLREAVKGLVPPTILDRPKAGFGVPLRRWLSGPLADWFAEQVDPIALDRRGIFDGAAVGRLRTANQSGTIDATYPLLAVAFIERWSQLFLDGGPSLPSINAPKGLSWETVT